MLRVADVSGCWLQVDVDVLDPVAVLAARETDPHRPVRLRERRSVQPAGG